MFIGFARLIEDLEEEPSQMEWRSRIVVDQVMHIGRGYHLRLRLRIYYGITRRRP